MVEETRLEVGRVLCNKWRIDAQLGQGGMATVWSGTHRNGMRVAIKALRAEVATSADIRERFLREGYVANHIDHPGVVTILDDDVSDDGVVFLVMELLEGMSLKDMWMERDRLLPPSEVVLVTHSMLDVLAAAHDSRVVHRDIKPDNVFLLSGGGIRILDFGIARLREIDGMDQRTRTGSMLGTPAFMPPEQALGHWDDVDKRSDIWAVGATMWTLLTGRLVHKAKTVQELLVAAATAHAAPIHSVLPDLDPRLAKVVDRALQFDPDQRWQTAREMAGALAPLTRADPATDIMPQRPAAPTSGMGVHGSWNSVGPSPLIAQDTPTTQMDTPTHVMAEPAEPVAPLAHDAAATALAGTAERRTWPYVVGALSVGALIAGAALLASSEQVTQRQPSTPNAASANRRVAALEDTSQPSATASASASAPTPPRPVSPTPRPRPTLPSPPPPPPPPPPALDCAGKDFSNPACAR